MPWLAASAGKKARPNARWIEALLNLTLQRQRIRVTLRQVGAYFRSVGQVVRDDLVNIRQRDGRKFLRDFFGGRAALDRRNDGVEGYAGAANANRAERVGDQGNDGGCKNGGHTILRSHC